MIAQRPGFASEHEQRARTRCAGHALADRRKPLFDVAGHAIGAVDVPGPRAEGADRLRHVGQARVHVREHRDLRAIELRFQVLLRAVDDDQVGSQRQNPLQVGIQERPHARQRSDRRRLLIVAAHRDDLRARADRKQDLCHCRHQRDDARRPHLRTEPGRREHDGERRRCRYFAFALGTSHLALGTLPLHSDSPALCTLHSALSTV